MHTSIHTKIAYLHTDVGILRSYLGFEYFLNFKSTTWSEAESECRRVGMNLARIDSRREHDWVHQTFGKHRAWLGLNDRRREGHFVNSDGCPVKFKVWAYKTA